MSSSLRSDNHFSTRQIRVKRSILITSPRDTSNHRVPRMKRVNDRQSTRQGCAKPSIMQKNPRENSNNRIPRSKRVHERRSTRHGRAKPSKRHRNLRETSNHCILRLKGSTISEAPDKTVPSRRKRTVTCGTPVTTVSRGRIGVTTGEAPDQTVQRWLSGSNSSSIW